MNEQLDHIGLIRLSSVGDVIMALPALESLKRAHPRARFTWIVEARAKNVLEGHPLLDAIIEFPRTELRAKWKQAFGSLRTLPVLARFRKQLREERFDATIDFQGNLKSGICTFFAGAPIRIGYERAECREPNWLFTNRRLELGGEAIHRIDRDLLLAGLLGAPFEHHEPRITLAAADVEPADRLQASRDRTKPLVALHPGTSAFMPHKRWPLASYAKLARILRDSGSDVVVTWGPGELAMAEELGRLAEGAATIAPETPSMKGLYRLFEHAALVIGSDTGPIHLAVVHGMDVIVLLGPGDPRHYYPLHHPDRAFYERAPCSPCRFRACPDLICMHGIDPSRVGAKALEILAQL